MMLGRTCVSLSFCHVGRDGNKIAHKLSHLGRNFSGVRVWLEEVPIEAIPL